MNTPKIVVEIDQNFITGSLKGQLPEIIRNAFARIDSNPAKTRQLLFKDTISGETFSILPLSDAVKGAKVLREVELLNFIDGKTRRRT